MSAYCPTCDVHLEDDGTRVYCWRCTYEVRDVDDCRTYHDLAAEVNAS